MSDNEHSILNLTPDEKKAFAFLFSQADKDQLGVVTGENAVGFFERTKVSPNVLGEIWQIADTENRGFLSKPGFSIVLRLIGHYQSGKEPTPELAFKPASIPKFEGLQIPGIAAPLTSAASGNAIPSPTAGAFPANALQPQLSGQAPIRVPPIDPLKAQQYASLFERSGAQNGQLDGATAKAIFERAGLPNEILGRIWNLSDREQKGALNQTDFIVAMHLLTSMKTRAMTALPNTLPPGLYEAAARRGVAPPNRQGSGVTAVPRQMTGSSIGAPPRTQSPLARPPGYASPTPQAAQLTGTPWLVTPADKVKFDQFFNTIDTQGRGIITGEQAVTFFSDSRLPEETLAQIWDLADINSEGQLNKDEFAVAMYLIRQQRAPSASPLPAFLAPALVPPSMRKQPQQTQSTAPAFDNAANTSNLPKSAADDLFGLDEPPQAQSQGPALQPQGTGTSASRDPFAGSTPGSPSSPARFQPQPQQAGNMFKPFMPSSAFGASLASQNTGGSVGSNQAAAPRALPLQKPSSTNDDLLGDNETIAMESNKLTNETTELANMSNQIGNLRTQMEQTQAKKSTNQADLSATSNQKRDLEQRLQQFRAQYEQEVRTVKDLEQQLAASRDSTKKLGQELAMLEGTHQDLQTQHQTVLQALQADQKENASLKERISQVTADVTKLKPEIEKLKLDARQQKGLVSINKKQLATNEAERDRLQTEKASLEQEAVEREEQARNAAAFEPVASPAPISNLASPASTLTSTNPFFRKPSQEGPVDRSISPPTQTGASTGPTPSAFDQLFGPSSAFSPSGQAGSRTGTPPVTSFIGRTIPAASPSGIPAVMTDSVQSVSSVGEHTPAATPPLSEQVKDSPVAMEPPSPPEGRQFTASHLPVVNVGETSPDSEASSTRVIAPASRASGTDTPRDAMSSVGDTLSPRHVPGSFTADPKPETAAKEGIPGAFPTDVWPQPPSASTETTSAAEHVQPSTAGNDDFDSAFAGFGDSDKAQETSQAFAPSSSQSAAKVPGSEFPPIQTFESEDDESDSGDEATGNFDDHFTTASPPRNAIAAEHSISQPPPMASTITSAELATPTAGNGVPLPDAQHAPPTYEETNKSAFGGTGERTEQNQFPTEFGGLLPAREDPTSPPPPEDGPPLGTATSTTAEIQPSGSSRVHTPAPASTAVPVVAPAKNAFDEFDAFDDLTDAKEADKNGSDFDFGFGEHNAEYNPTFDSPAASMTNTMASSQQTPVPATRSLQHVESNGFNSFQPTISTSGILDSGHSSIQQTPQNVQHDWDSIFSGLDSSKAVDTSLSSNDPWGTAPATNGSSSAAVKAPTIDLPPRAPLPVPNVPPRGGAITPGTEHDDPILKRLTGMGYPRADALNALEKYDYDINKAVDHLTNN